MLAFDLDRSGGSGGQPGWQPNEGPHWPGAAGQSMMANRALDNVFGPAGRGRRPMMHAIGQ